MSELDIARLLNDKVVDFGNERFLEGWNGATEHIIKLLREQAKHLIQVSESIAMDEYMSDEDAAVPENGAFALNEFADALIKGEK